MNTNKNAITNVTVIMPAYNAEKYLEEAINSVLVQTYPHFELIIVNDGSQDSTGDILDRLVGADVRIKPLHQENAGIAEALNRALREAQTEWVLIMHADDIMLPDRIERQVDFIRENPDVKASSCLAWFISEEGRRLGKSSSDLLTREKFEWYREAGEVIGLLHPGVILHRETVLAIGGYRQSFWPAEDIDLWNRLSEQGHLILGQNEILMQYRIHQQSASTARFMWTRQKYYWARACMNARRYNHPEPDWDAFLQEWRSAPFWNRLNRERKNLAKAYYHEAGLDCLHGHYLKGLPKLFAAMVLQPGYVVSRLKTQMG